MNWPSFISTGNFSNSVFTESTASAWITQLIRLFVNPRHSEPTAVSQRDCVFDSPKEATRWTFVEFDIGDK